MKPDVGNPATAAPRPPAGVTPRPPAVAGLFYPGRAGELGALVDGLVAESRSRFPTPPALDRGRLAGILVPHAGLVYSGLVAAAAWRLVTGAGEHGGPSGSGGSAPTIVLLGTNHGAAWLDGVGAWDRGPWRSPLGDVGIDEALTDAILDLGAPFAHDPACHLGEHSIEVQVPFVARLLLGSRVVALSVGAGTGGRAIAAGERLGGLLGARRAAGERLTLVISSDMAHYPPARVSESVTDLLRRPICRVEPEELATAEAAVVRDRREVSCGMCGIEPAVLGLAALRAMGASAGSVLAAATSADAGGDPGRTVGYLAVGFEA